MSVDDVMSRILQRIGGEPPEGVVPEWKLEEMRSRERERAKASREAVAALELPSRAVALCWANQVAETEGVLALRNMPTLTCLSGGTGCGKTVAAAHWLFRSARDNHIRGMWVTAARLARWPRYSATDVDRLLKAPRLVVDDLGGEFLDEKGSFMSLFDELVNERYASSRLTVLTTNHNAAAFKARYSERVVDRIREDGKFVEISAASFRGHAVQTPDRQQGR